ncbi:LamG domain-containing protein [bacterium]|nr:LamG domain-containing protein [bacterium]
MIRFTCSHCGSVLSVQDSLAGTSGACPRCKGMLRVPDLEAAGDGPAAPARPRAAPRPPDYPFREEPEAEGRVSAPDDEDVIEFSRGRFRRSMIWLLGFQALALLVGVGCLFGCLALPWLEPLSLKMLTAEVFAGGVALVAFCYFYAGVCSWKLFFVSTVPASDYYLLTADRLRRYTRRGDLVEDIPYANVADVRLITRTADDNPDVKVRLLGIDLRDPDHPKTTLDETFFRWSRQMYQHDVVLIEEFFAGSLRGVHKKIRRRWQRWQDTNPPEAAVRTRRSRRRAAAAWYKSPLPYVLGVLGIAGVVGLVVAASRVGPGHAGGDAPAQAAGPPPPPAPVATVGPVAYWPLDEGQGTETADAGGKGIAAHFQGGAGWGSGVKGAGVRLDGKAAYVDLGPIGPRFAAGAPFTVCGWVTTESPDGVICSFRNQTSPFPVIELSVRTGRLAGWVRDDTSGQGGAKLLGGRADDGKWHHAALAREPDGTVELYLDGVSQGRDKGANSGGPVTTNYRALGCDRFLLMTGKKSPGFLAGGLDEVRVYDRRLPAEEVAALARGQ